MSSIIFVNENDIATAWLESVRRVFLEGDDIKTQYDRKGDPPAKDSTVLINVKKPFENPMKVGRDKRVLELESKFGNKWVVYGHKGDVILPNEVRAGYIEMVLYGDAEYRKSENYSYDYNDRLTNWKPYVKRDVIYRKYENKFEDIMFPSIDQIQFVIEALKESPISRRIQATTWKPLVDPYNHESPCLQRLWFRVKNNKLLCESSWRSRDLWSAWQSNVNAIIRIQELVAKEIGVEIGEYIDFSNSLHIYGKDINYVRDFLEQMNLL